MAGTSTRATAGKPHVCEMCGNRFATPDKLKKHFKIHEKEFRKKSMRT